MGISEAMGEGGLDMENARYVNEVRVRMVFWFFFGFCGFLGFFLESGLRRGRGEVERRR